MLKSEKLRFFALCTLFCVKRGVHLASDQDCPLLSAVLWLNTHKVVLEWVCKCEM